MRGTSTEFAAAVAPAGFMRNASADPDLRQWLNRLRQTISDACRRWDLEVVDVMPSQYSIVLAVIRTGGFPSVLKVIPPDDFSILELPALRAYEGICSPLLLMHDDDLGALLLEQVTPGKPLLHWCDDDATNVLAEVMGQLWSVPTTRLQPSNRLSDWAAGRPDLMRWRAQQHGGLVSSRLLDRAIEILHSWDDSDEDVILHGDLHHGNVLTSDRCGWVAIDPSSRVGRREAEVAAMLRNPWGCVRDIGQLRTRHARRLTILCETLDLDIELCQRWAFANSLDLAMWSAISGRADDADYLFSIAVSLEE